MRNAGTKQARGTRASVPLPYQRQRFRLTLDPALTRHSTQNTVASATAYHLITGSQL